MDLFLTSSPCSFDGESFTRPVLNPANGFLERLADVWPAGGARILFVASDPDDAALTDLQAEGMTAAYAAAGLPIESTMVLDSSSARRAGELLARADVVHLCGGHVPTQAAFFERVSLRTLIGDFHGIVIGVSAGSMNCADTVYALPEERGEAVDPAYARFIRGLGLTDINVIPHRDQTLGTVLDGLDVVDDIACPDSIGREFLFIPDGSFVHVHDGLEELCGSAWLIRNGAVERLQ